MREPRRYRVDLMAQQSLCQANYARLLKILPFLKRQDQCTFAVPYRGQQAELQFQRVEQTRYTQLLNIKVSTSWSKLITAPSMQVRIYHDAQLAEVVSTDTHRYLSAYYHYPNSKMYQPDEKLQLNRFLADWLNHCLHGGHLDELPSPF